MSKPPLWEVMERARDAAIATHHPFARDELCLAAEIRAVRDWLASQLPEVGAEVIRTLLTAEADRAERS